MHVIRLVPCTFLNIGKPPPPKKSTIFALRTHKNCLLVRFSLGLGFRAVTYTGWISFSVENKHSGSVYSYKSDRMLFQVFLGKNLIILSILATCKKRWMHYFSTLFCWIKEDLPVSLFCNFEKRIKFFIWGKNFDFMNFWSLQS